MDSAGLGWGQWRKEAWENMDSARVGWVEAGAKKVCSHTLDC